MFTRAAAGQRNTSGKPGSGRGFAIGRWQQPGARAARGAGRAAGVVPRRGDRHARRGPDPGADHRRRQPAGVHAQLGPAGAGGRGAGLHALDRHLPERDHPPRRRDPARRPARWRSRTTTWRSTSWPPATWPTTRPPSCRPTGCPRSGRRWRGWPGSCPARARTPTSSGVDDMVIGALVAREVGDAHSRIAGRDAGRDPGRARAAARARADPRPAAAHRALRRRLRRRPRWPHARAAGGEPARHRPGPADARASPRCCAPPRARSSWRRPSSWPTCRGCPRRAGRRNGDMVLVGRRQLRSNNSWMHNLESAGEGQGPLHRPRAPRRRRAAGPGRRRPARAALERGRDRGAGGGHRRRDAGRGELPHGWGHDAPGMRMRVAARTRA